MIPAIATITDPREFAALRAEWDPLVAAMPRPSPFLLHGWLLEWWRHHGPPEPPRRPRRPRGTTGSPAPCRCSSSTGSGCGSRASSARTRPRSPTSSWPTAPIRRPCELLVERAAGAGADFADLFGLPESSRLAAAAGDRAPPARPARRGARARPRARMGRGVPRQDVGEAPQPAPAPPQAAGAARRGLVRGRARSRRSSPRRSRRRSSCTRRAGATCRRRRASRPRPGSSSTAPRWRRWRRWACRGSGCCASTARRWPATTTSCSADCMYFHELAFDPLLARWSPGQIATLDSIEAAAAEGARRVEFLGGAERYKLELADRSSRSTRGSGWRRRCAGRAALSARTHAVHARMRLKETPVRRMYYDGLAPARRIAQARQQRDVGAARHERAGPQPGPDAVGDRRRRAAAQERDAGRDRGAGRAVLRDQDQVERDADRQRHDRPERRQRRRARREQRVREHRAGDEPDRARQQPQERLDRAVVVGAEHEREQHRSEDRRDERRRRA